MYHPYFIDSLNYAGVWNEALILIPVFCSFEPLTTRI